MLPQRQALLARAVARTVLRDPKQLSSCAHLRAARYASSSPGTTYDHPPLDNPEINDPEMNGGYINPPAISRQLRDPHADWWDKQERKNFGEPVHEDNDILGMFALEEYPGQSASRGLVQIGCFITAILTLCGICYVTYPDKQSYPRDFPGGLEKELGGPMGMRARKIGDPVKFKGE